MKITIVRGRFFTIVFYPLASANGKGYSLIDYDAF